MSNRSIRKRRHRPDFQEYMELRKTALNAGFSSITAYQLVLKKLEEMRQQKETENAQAVQTVTLDDAQAQAHLDTHAHVHGPDCHHDE